VRQELHPARRGDDRAEGVGRADRDPQASGKIEETRVPEQGRADVARLDVEGERVEGAARLRAEADRRERAAQVAGRMEERRQVPRDDAQAARVRRVDEPAEPGRADEVGAPVRVRRLEVERTDAAGPDRGGGGVRRRPRM
jgi:hypothetical protein